MVGEQQEHPWLRRIPSIEALLLEGTQDAELGSLPRPLLTDILRETAAELRAALAAGGEGNSPGADADGEAVRHQLTLDLLARARHKAGALVRPFYRRAINATGIILHTGLGRAPLPAAALRQIAGELRGYSVLQQSVETGERSRRDAGVERLLQRLTGAEAATVVNNNAAATMIALQALASGKEVIVSRGQLIEIGGSFRLPDVMAASGARLVEVGTTNKTHLRDYERAITPATGAIMRVHPSNYRIHGFAKSVATEELVALARPRGIPVIDDLGAGALIDLSRFGFEKEPTIQESLRAGADLVLSSADKLIGGPQGGIILGRADLIGLIRKSPLARIVRVDKLTLAALEATLRSFLDTETAWRDVPTLRLLRRPLEEIAAAAESLGRELLGDHPIAAEVTIEEGVSFMGGGSLPEQQLPTRLVAIRPVPVAATEFAARLRRGTPAVFARIHDDRVLLDPRTLLEGEAEEVAAAIRAALPPVAPSP
ncbi:MAG TPA: L-seryl-tRNA(Sec) selenium transferase [Verrucomicrobiae bacterium]|nr:L-seryl-tRNA(Sec) selenium transferase [Verrucomicrobiae bacterium]